MEPTKLTKTERLIVIRTVGFVFSPLALAYLWGAFVDQESFEAFVLGVLFTGLFGLLALARFLLKRAAKGPHKPPDG